MPFVRRCLMRIRLTTAGFQVREFECIFFFLNNILRDELEIRPARGRVPG